MLRLFSTQETGILMLLKLVCILLLELCTMAATKDHLNCYVLFIAVINVPGFALISSRTLFG